MYKTQVFLCPEGDHYRTRLTHALEVSRIARTMARALGLNEALTEAAALGHDVGHTPFGHAGERALNDILPGGFTHNGHSERVLSRLEKGGAGHNLCPETLDAIACHTGPQLPASCEGMLVRLADRIAYVNHDMDDAIRAGLLTEGDLPPRLRDILGGSHTQRIDTMVKDVVSHGRQTGEAAMGAEVGAASDELRAFMFERVYLNDTAKSEERKVAGMIARLYEHYVAHPEDMPGEQLAFAERDGTERAAADYVAGMTDRFCREKAQELFFPRSWAKH
jgi:dGTPase